MDAVGSIDGHKTILSTIFLLYIACFKPLSKICQLTATIFSNFYVPFATSEKASSADCATIFSDKPFSFSFHQTDVCIAELSITFHNGPTLQMSLQHRTKCNNNGACVHQGIKLLGRSQFHFGSKRKLKFANKGLSLIRISCHTIIDPALNYLC